MVASASEASGPSVANAHPVESALPTAITGVVANPGVAPTSAVPADVVLVPGLARYTLSAISAEDAEEAQVCDSFGSRSPVDHERTRSVGSLSTAPVKRMLFDEPPSSPVGQAVYQSEVMAALMRSSTCGSLCKAPPSTLRFSTRWAMLYLSGVCMNHSGLHWPPLSQGLCC